jgi:hypothetical protein
MNLFWATLVIAATTAIPHSPSATLLSRLLG